MGITTLATARPPEAAISKEPPRALNTEVEPAPPAAPMPRAPPVADIKPVPKEQALIEPAPVKEAPPSTAPVAKPVPPRESVPPNEPPPVLSEPPVIAAPLAPAVKPEAPPPPPPVAPAPVLKIAPAPAPLPPKPTPVIVLPPPPVIQLPPRNNVRAGDRVPIAIRVQPAGALVEMQSVVVSGLPTQMAIENATRNGLGAWVLTPAALSDALIVIPPATAAGEIELTYELIGPEGRSVASARTLLVITQPPPVVVAQPAPLVVTPPAPVRRAESEEMLAMLKRGRDMLEQGDIAGARLFFLRAGEGGSADGAFLLAETYDPEVLEQRRVVGGVAPDLAQARQWYMRALTLGSREAEARLQKLPAQ